MPANLSIARLFALAASFAICSPAIAASPNLVISQVYGGGGNAGAPLTNDFIEIFNRGSAPVSLNGLSVQYTSAAGTANFGVTNQITLLSNVTLNPGQYWLIQESGTAGASLPGADQAGPIAMAAGAGKVIIATGTTTLGCNGGSTPCNAAQLARIIDLIGYGGSTTAVNFFEGAPGPALSNTLSASRNSSGCVDTDNNAADFTAGAPAPRGSQSPIKSCNAAQPTSPSASGSASPASLSAGDTTTLTVTVTPGTNPASTGLSVSGDLSSIGGSLSQAFTDNGGGTFSFVATVGVNTSAGTKTIPIVVTDAQSRSGSTTISLTVTAAVPKLAIHDIQGPTHFSPFAGQQVQTEGVVTGVKSNGYFIQAPDAEVDGDSRTSEGIFVFTSSAPPTAAVVGNRLRVRATVQDFIPSADTGSPPVTELANTTAVTLLSTGNPLPVPVTITGADLDPAGEPAQLVRYEGMRVHVDTVNVVAPTQGNINEPNATSTSNGTFYGVLPGTARPFREPGIEVPLFPNQTVPASVPLFDGNPERLRIDSDGQVGAVRLDVATGAVVSNLTGVLDFGFRVYTIDPDAASAPIVTNNDAHAVPVRLGAGEGEFTVASFNMERFYDTVNDPATSDAVLNAAGFERRLAKASLVIRNVLQMPDVIGVEEMENLTTLTAVADRVNADASAAGQPQPNYVAYLFEGNDIGGIDVGLLVKPERFDGITVVQRGKDTIFAFDGKLLDDRPPLVMTAIVKPRGKELPLPVTIIVNHLRSLSGIDDPVDGTRIQKKRLAQAEELAGLIDEAQHGLFPNVISVGDYNAFDVNDGYADVINTVRGGPPHPSEDLEGEPNQLVETPLIDLAPADPAQHYSYSFDGNAQVLDHIIVSQSLTVNEFTYARNDADFPESLRNDATRPERISDHDMPVAYFSVPRDTVAPSVSVTGVSEGAFYRFGAVPAAGCTTTDDASGVRTPASPQISGGNGDGTGSFTATCTGAVDNVGNAAADVSVHYSVDGRPPAVSVTGVADGAFYRLGAVPGAACVTTDDLSGVATPATLAITGGNDDGTGSFTATCAGAVDNVGNVAADVSVHYTVDGRPPTVTVTGVAEGAFYRLGATPAAGCSTTDDASGVGTPASLRITGGNAGGNAGGTGAFTATCTGAVDNVGNAAADVSVHYTVDGLAPAVFVTGVKEGAFYRPGGVPLTDCVTIDDASGVRTPAFLRVTGGNSDGTGFFTATCTGAVDNVGNAAAAVSVHYAVDGRPPTVAVTGVTNGATYLLGAVPAAGCTTADDLSGVSAPAHLAISGGDANGVGSITATCSGAADNVGNVAAAVSVRYTVVAYSFGGFRPPLGQGIRRIESGETVPLKFQIRDWTGKLVTSTSVVSAIEFARNPTCSGVPATGWQSAAAKRGKTLQFDRDDRQFEFEWKTTGLVAGCYSIAVRTADTLRHAALVAVRADGDEHSRDDHDRDDD